MRKILRSRFLVLFLFSLVIVLPMVSTTRSQDEEGSKGIKSEEVVSRSAKNPAVQPTQRRGRPTPARANAPGSAAQRRRGCAAWADAVSF